MKFIISQLSYFVHEREVRRNLGALLKYLAFVLGVITVYSVLFHLIMLNVEGEQHSWLTGFYWTLTVMSTTGFGDITFHSDLGRVFSIVVLLSGMVLLLIMLPFAFIRFFYAPWLEAQIRLQAPRAVGPDVTGHVLICRYDSIAPGLIRKLQFNNIPYALLEPDAATAGRRVHDGVSVIVGEIDSRKTYEQSRVSDARLVFANAEDKVNTAVTLTIRAVDTQVPIVALAENEDSIDILELSGVTHVLPLKRKLGEVLASRINAGGAACHVVGRFRNLLLAEFVAHDSPLADKTLKETRLRALTGANVVAVWEQGRLHPVTADTRLTKATVPVLIGTEEHLRRLDDLLGVGEPYKRPVLVIGGGKVGQSAARALRRQQVAVHLVEKSERMRRRLESVVDRLVIGDAADREVLIEAGLEAAGAAVLTTNDDAINIYLTVYCRRLKPDLNIVSRITHERNIEAVYRAGADSVLSYASLGREHVISQVLGREPIMVGEGADFFLIPVPASLAGQTLGRSQIGSRTGLIVVAIEDDAETRTNPAPDCLLPVGGRLLMLGTAEQRQAFAAGFE